MPNYSINQRSCTGGVRTVSPDVTVPAKVGSYTSIEVSLTSSEWASKAGTGILAWGIDRSNDGGATWDEWVRVPAQGDPGIPIGSTTRDGRASYFLISWPDLIDAVGCRVRLWAQPSVTIRLGATVTAS